MGDTPPNCQGATLSQDPNTLNWIDSAGNVYDANCNMIGNQNAPGQLGSQNQNAAATAIPMWVWVVGLGVVGFAVYEMMRKPA